MTASAIFNTRIPSPYQYIMEAISSAAVDMAKMLRLGDGGPRADDEPQVLIARSAQKLFRDRLKGAGVRWLALEGEAGVSGLNPSGAMAVALDPLHASANIAANGTAGTIFSIHRAAQDGEASFLGAGCGILAAGYIIYGPRTCLVVSFGQGTQVYRLNAEAGRFDLVNDRLLVPDHAHELAINAADYRHWPQSIRTFFDDCLAAEEGPVEDEYNLRWNGSLVAEAHRILMQGGIYLAPVTRREGPGPHHHLFEAAPMAFVLEQAGGRASDGEAAILSHAPAALAERRALIFGSAMLVERVAAYHDLPEPDLSALFGNRGLFRASRMS